MRKFRHGNNPVLNWMASCLQLQYDHKDNCQPIETGTAEIVEAHRWNRRRSQRSGARIGCAGQHDHVYGVAKRRLIRRSGHRSARIALERAASEQGHNR